METDEEILPSINKKLDVIIDLLYKISKKDVKQEDLLLETTTILYKKE
jgi:hypothetical protein